MHCQAEGKTKKVEGLPRFSLTSRQFGELASSCPTEYLEIPKDFSKSVGQTRASPIQLNQPALADPILGNSSRNRWQATNRGPDAAPCSPLIGDASAGTVGLEKRLPQIQILCPGGLSAIAPKGRLQVVCAALPGGNEHEVPGTSNDGAGRTSRTRHAAMEASQMSLGGLGGAGCAAQEGWRRRHPVRCSKMARQACTTA
jgi:hypothetical protein